MSEKISVLTKGKAPFKILLLSDTHFGAGFLSRKTDKAAEHAVRTIAERANADLIIVNGDMIYPIFAFSGTTNNKKQAERVLGIMESLKTPWAFTFGNHDQERHSKYDKNALADIYMRGKYCLFQKGPDNIDGVGNYIIKIENGNENAVKNPESQKNGGENALRARRSEKNTETVNLKAYQNTVCNSALKENNAAKNSETTENTLPHSVLKENNSITNSKKTENGGSLNTVLVFLDSNMYMKKGYFSGFDHVHDNQIEWYKDQIAALSKKEGRIVPSLMFCHLPIKEFSDAWRMLYLGKVKPSANEKNINPEYKNLEKTAIQKRNNSNPERENFQENRIPECEKNMPEVVYHCGFVNEKDNYFGYPKTMSTHIFDDVLALGSTKGMFFGHDHLNTLSLTYKGVRLTYSMSIDYLAYIGIRKKNTQRGGTLIEIFDDASFDVRHIPLFDDCPMKKIKL
ncbi:MAG: metallophosphoesterase [Clostridiales bacterium]|jgi:predicted MPP superfamily phosphohydrolase|nr:metallophosphoesterase [Clostridiales bacterium]